MSVSARSVAFGVIRRVVEDDAYSTRVMPAALARSGLDVRDRAFATDLAYGTLRKKAPLDWAIAQKADRPVRRISPGALAALRLGAYQLMFTGTAPHAAVAETVDLVSDRERGFVNAVLRRLAASPPVLPQGDSVETISIRTGLAEWAVAELARLVGDETAAAAAALAEPAGLSLRTNTCAGSVVDLERSLVAEGRSVRRSELDPTCLLMAGGDPSSLPGYREGRFAIQDQASSFVVRSLAPEPGDRILDACAAPGGKAAHAACLVGATGQVVAADVHPERTRLICAGADRLGHRPLVLAADATAPAVRGSFDRVLVDAPCSGIGSARRRPELLWRPRRDQLSRFARSQVAIATASVELLRPGGRFVYSVCTFPRAETDAVCDALERRRPDLEPVSIDGPDGPSARVRIWPHRHGADGMFVAAYAKRG